jgi:hypothetical protein
LETLLEGSPMCVAQLTESGHSCPLPPKCCFTASNILQEWQSDSVYSERPGNADVLDGSLGPGSRRGSQRSQGGRDLTIFFQINIHLRETSEAEDSL